MYLDPSPSSSFIHLLFSDNFSFHYAHHPRPVDFSVLVELNSGFDIGMLFYGLVLRVIRI